MHALTDPRLFLWMTQKNVYGKLKRNKIAVDVSHMSHSRTYTLDYPVKKMDIKKKKRKIILKRLVEKHYFFCSIYHDQCRAGIFCHTFT